MSVFLACSGSDSGSDWKRRKSTSTVLSRMRWFSSLVSSKSSKIILDPSKIASILWKRANCRKQIQVQNSLECWFHDLRLPLIQRLNNEEAYLQFRALSSSYSRGRTNVSFLSTLIWKTRKTGSREKFAKCKFEIARPRVSDAWIWQGLSRLTQCYISNLLLICYLFINLYVSV